MTSVPKRPGTLRPAARAPAVNSFAAFPRLSDCTRRRSSCAIVTGWSGLATCFGAAGTGAGTGGTGSVAVTVGSVTAGSVTVGSVTVGGTTGGSSTGGGVSLCLRANARSSSDCAVSGSLARNEASSFAPISPAAVTT